MGRIELPCRASIENTVTCLLCFVSGSTLIKSFLDVVCTNIYYQLDPLQNGGRLAEDLILHPIKLRSAS